MSPGRYWLRYPEDNKKSYRVRDGRVYVNGKDVTFNRAIDHNYSDEDVSKYPTFNLTQLKHNTYEMTEIEVKLLDEMIKKTDDELKRLLSAQEAAQPPSAGEKVLLFFIPKREREYLPGDLAEEFVALAAKHGVRYAKAWYWKQVVASVGPIIAGYARKLVLLGVVAKVYEVVRRMF